MTTREAIAIIGLILILIYSIVATIWIICPQVLMRWADYFGIQIKDKPLEPLFENDEEENQIEVKELKR